LVLGAALKVARLFWPVLVQYREVG